MPLVQPGTAAPCAPAGVCCTASCSQGSTGLQYSAREREHWIGGTHDRWSRGSAYTRRRVSLGTRPTRRRSASVTIGVAAALAATLSGCGTREEYTHGAVCADRQTQQRVGDDRCDDGRVGGGGGLYEWYYLRAGSRAQPIGARVGGGSFTAPPSGAAVYRGGVPSEGGAVTRGGFGGRSVSVGG